MLGSTLCLIYTADIPAIANAEMDVFANNTVTSASHRNEPKTAALQMVIKLMRTYELQLWDTALKANRNLIERVSDDAVRRRCAAVCRELANS